MTSPVFEETLYLANSLFSVKVTEGCTSKAGRTIKNEAFGVSIETALGKDSSHAFGLDGR